MIILMHVGKASRCHLLTILVTEGGVWSRDKNSAEITLLMSVEGMRWWDKCSPGFCRYSFKARVQVRDRTSNSRPVLEQGQGKGKWSDPQSSRGLPALSPLFRKARPCQQGLPFPLPSQLTQSHALLMVFSCSKALAPSSLHEEGRMKVQFILSG